LDVFARGEDVYVYTAQSVGSQNRTLGKVMRLALGFGMGPVKFRDTARGYGIDLSLEEAEIKVGAFRSSNKRIEDLWYSYETAARQVIAMPSLGTIKVGRVGFRMALSTGKLAGSLLIEKPSGSVLVYRNARLENGIIFDGVDQFTKKWGPIRTYGGKLVENVTQSVARDLLADAMLEFEKACPECLRVTVHDEIAAIALETDATRVLATLKRIMSEAPWWGEGLPLSGAGYVAARYGKA
jgi:DNA polymerase